MTDSTDRHQPIKQVSAYLRVHNAEAAIVFYTEVFNAIEIFRLIEPSDRVGHAELQFGPAIIMVSDEYPELGIMSPMSIEGTSVGIYLQVDEVDKLYERALNAGATSLQEPADQFFGERMAKLRDPFGHEWLLAQKTEELSAVEMQERFDALFQKK